MENRMTVHRDGAAIYDIVLAPSYEGLREELAALGIAGRRCCIVTDSTVAEFYLQEAVRALANTASQVDVFVFPAGEENKNLDTVRHLYEFLILHFYDRKDVLFALGGGVVGDLTGFAAATYLRGIRFVQLPTTLLAQVDSSIGGKTGVDFDAYKNMVGAFHMPILVYAASHTLLTLTAEQFACGLGEILKHGLIQDAAYYRWLIENHDAICRRDLPACEKMIHGSCLIKRAVVEEDPTEQGRRALLNFGHTLGHAIEKLMNFSLPHGQCVALGALAASYLSAQRGLLSESELQEIIRSFSSFSLPVSLSGTGLSAQAVITATKSDKKMDSGRIRFVLLEKIGSAFTDMNVTDGDMRQALVWLGAGR